jgi:hypothetical protein
LKGNQQFNTIGVAKADFIAATMIQPDEITRGLMLLPQLANPVFEGVKIELVLKGKRFLRLPAALPLCNQFTHEILSFCISHIKNFLQKSHFKSFLTICSWAVGYKYATFFLENFDFFYLVISNL